MSALKESGLSASTNVAMWSDHGDYAGDYGLVEKWPSGLEDVLTRVPLLIRAPQSAMAAEDRDFIQCYCEISRRSMCTVLFPTSLKLVQYSQIRLNSRF